jgi:hypothetical protein
MHYNILLIEKDWQNARPHARFKYAREASFYLIAYCATLPGEEIPMTDLNGVLKHWSHGISDPSQPHVAFRLMGQFKNKVGKKYHYIPIAATAKNGLQSGCG